MLHDDASYDLNELCERSGVTARTVRYYIAQGLLRAPGQTGPGSHYDRGHLDRLRLIRLLQERHQPLAEIRRRLGGLSDAEVAQLLVRESKQAPASSAVDYVRSVLGPPAPPAPGAQEGAQPPRSQWERIALTADVELHVRRPLAREDQRRVERLVEEARRILAGR